MNRLIDTMTDVAAYNIVSSVLGRTYEGSEWQCLMFGGTPDNGLKWRPPKGGEPNWFWRKMQYLILGNEWVKDRKLTNAELYDHYDFFIDNCTGNEIPLSFKEWKREHGADLIELFNND